MQEERFQYHFEPKKGWMNDPNGLCYFNGKYHAFFQHNPFAPKWDVMHWGHAVSNDLITWEELPIALYPDREYENQWGCFSGSAIEKDGVLHLIYTAVGKTLGSTQALATTKDGITFTKHPNNPLITRHPCNKEGEINQDFRDPKVFFAFNAYYMVLGGGYEGKGQIFLYRSNDLINWEFVNIIYQTDEFGVCLECPDMFFINGKWILIFSAVAPTVASTVFVVGDFNGESFLKEKICYSEFCRDFYAPQTFEDPLTKERVIIGWMDHHGRDLPAWATTAGGFSIPRTLTYKNGYVYNYPVAQAQKLLTHSCEFVKIENTTISVYSLEGKLLSKKDFRGVNGIEKFEKVEILFDKKTVEIFINGGLISFSQWLI